MKKFYTFIFLFVFVSLSSKAQFYVVPDTGAVQLVNDFILTGVTATNVQYTGDTNTLGSFALGNLTNLGMDDGIAMTTGTFDTTINVSIGDPVNDFANYSNNFPGDPLLNSLIAPWTTYDASVLEFDLNPVGNILEFQYVFASEEYPEYVGSSFNDVFGFFITGPNPAGGNYQDYNIAILPDDSLPVAINNVNADTNNLYFVDNLTTGGQTIVFDGFTTVLVATAYVVPAATYHLKMAIADAGDGVFDSGIFLKAQSMKSYLITSIDEQSAYVADVYPNPLNSNSTLNLNLSQSGKVLLNISDRLGKLIYSETYNFSNTGNNDIAIGQILNNYPQGIYFINIQTPDGNSFSKVVK